jgi:cytosine permease
VFIVGGVVSALLGGLSAYAGARTRMTLALLAEATFGRRGANVVQAAIALSLIGWFSVIVSVLGATASATIAQIYGLQVPTPAIAIPLCGLIVWIARHGIGWLERLGIVIVPLTFLLLGIAVLKTAGQFAVTSLQPISTTMTFGSGVSSVIGAYIVGIIIQPDYGRFVRRPSRAALAAILSLGAVYPLILSLSAIPSAALHRPDLIAALIALGIGIPALALLLLGAWIDASACLYSGSLAFAKLVSGVSYGRIVSGAGLLCASLAFAHGERYFMPFLQVLGVALPPIAAVQCVTALWPARARGGAWVPRAAVQVYLPAIGAWALGTMCGILAQNGGWSASGIPAIDSIIAASIAATLVCASEGRWTAQRRAAS